MKSKNFWKQFAFELAVSLSLPISFLIGVTTIILLTINGYGLHLLVTTVSLTIFVALCVTISDAWKAAKKEVGKLHG